MRLCFGVRRFIAALIRKTSERFMFKVRPPRVGIPPRGGRRALQLHGPAAVYGETALPRTQRPFGRDGSPNRPPGIAAAGTGGRLGEPSLPHGPSTSQADTRQNTHALNAPSVGTHPRGVRRAMLRQGPADGCGEPSLPKKHRPSERPFAGVKHQTLPYRIVSDIRRLLLKGLVASQPVVEKIPLPHHAVTPGREPLPRRYG